MAQQMKMAVLLTLLVASLVFIDQSSGLCDLEFKTCPGSTVTGHLTAIRTNGTCSGGEAVLKKGTKVMVDFTFSTPMVQTKLTSEVAGKIGPIYVNFPLDDENACDDFGLKCPISANKMCDYLPILDIKSIFPSITLLVRWKLLDVNNKEVFCALMPAKIVS